MSIIALAIVALAVTTDSPAKVKLAPVLQFYVAPSGTDTVQAGTNKKPWKSLGFAVEQMDKIKQKSASVQINLAAGKYLETQVSNVPPNVSVKGAGVNQTIISAKLNDEWLIQLDSEEIVDGRQSLSGFTIDGQKRKLRGGVFVGNRNNVTLSNLKFNEIRSNGATVHSKFDNRSLPTPVFITGIKILQCEFIDSAMDFETYSGGNLEIGGLKGGLVDGIKITSKTGYGIKFVNNGYFLDTTVTNCRIKLSESDRLWGEKIAIELWNLGPGNKVSNIICNTWLSLVNHPRVYDKPKGYENLHVHDVLMIDEDGHSSKEGIEIATPGTLISRCYIENKGFGFAIWDAGNRNIALVNNIVVNDTYKDNFAGGAGVFIANSTAVRYENIQVANNIFVKCRAGVLLSADSATGMEDIRILNNVFLDVMPESFALQGRGTNGFNSDPIGMVSFENNLVWPGPNSVQLVFLKVKESNTVKQDPMISKSGPKWTTFYRSSNPTSPLNTGLKQPARSEDKDISHIGPFELIQVMAK